jgi:hypothetical protein
VTSPVLFPVVVLHGDKLAVGHTCRTLRGDAFPSDPDTSALSGLDIELSSQRLARHGQHKSEDRREAYLRR